MDIISFKLEENLIFFANFHFLDSFTTWGDSIIHDFSKIEDAKGGMLRQKSKIIQGIDREISQKINKIIKNSKFKVQFAIRGEELRITGDKRDVLQEVIQTIKNLEIKQPLQFINFRD